DHQPAERGVALGGGSGGERGGHRRADARQDRQRASGPSGGPFAGDGAYHVDGVRERRRQDARASPIRRMHDRQALGRLSPEARAPGVPVRARRRAGSRMSDPKTPTPRPKSRANILIVDDRPEGLKALETVLSDLGEPIIKASSGQEALGLALDNELAVILLDVRMPE